MYQETVSWIGFCHTKMRSDNQNPEGLYTHCWALVVVFLIYQGYKWRLLNSLWTFGGKALFLSNSASSCGYDIIRVLFSLRAEDVECCEGGRKSTWKVFTSAERNSTHLYLEIFCIKRTATSYHKGWCWHYRFLKDKGKTDYHSSKDVRYMASQALLFIPAPCGMLIT